jgi:BirA family transcriptional regulator, biotin operon repressor / biotin---[acetyl-CoA-carboxylase] ligase
MKRIHHDTIDSTNAEAQRLARRGEREPVLITATRQTAGRGRDGRTWQSPAGGAWMSVLWPTHSSAERYAALPLFVGMAVRRAIVHALGLATNAGQHSVEIKWPNDVLLNGEKVSGVLCETVHDGAGLTHVVIGVGINVDFPIKALKGELRHPPTTLGTVTGHRVAVEDVVGLFQREVEQTLPEFDREGLTHACLEEVRAHLAYVGSTRWWRFGEDALEGRITGIDEAGRLLLEVEGTVRAIDHGELCSVSSQQFKTLI